MRKIGLILAIIMITISLVGCSSQPNKASKPEPVAKAASQSVPLEKVSLSYTARTAAFLPAQVALDKGYFKEAGLEVEFVQMKPNVTVAALDAGEIQYTLTFGSTLEAIMKGMKFRVLMIVTANAPQFLVSRPEIKTIADLKGKTLGSGKVGGSGDLAAKAIIEGKGFQGDMVKSVAIGDGPVLAEALRQKTIDSASLPPPWPLVLRKEGYNILGGPKDSKFASPVAGITAKVDLMQKNPDQVMNILKALLRAQAFIQQNRDEAAAIMSKWLEQDLASAKESMELLVETYSVDGLLNEQQLELILAERRKSSNIESNLKANDVFDFSLLRQVSKTK